MAIKTIQKRDFETQQIKEGGHVWKFTYLKGMD
jgi:hypothetical protein